MDTHIEPMTTRWSDARVVTFLVISAFAIAFAWGAASPSQTLSPAQAASQNGSTRAATPAEGHAGELISFDREDPNSPGDTFAYITNLRGHNTRLLVATHSCCAGFSPNGRRLVLPRLTSDGRIGTAIVNVDGSHYRPLPIADPSLNIGCGTGSWSPDGKVLTCETWDDSSPARNGMYTISARTGKVIRRVTTNRLGGHDIPGSYSPSGHRILFVRQDADGAVVGLFVVRTDGRQQRQITSAGSDLNIGADWSPRHEIVFSRHVTPDARGSLWVVHPDGSALRPISIRARPCGGASADPQAIGCHGPRWSPDGRRLVFAGGGDIYTARVNGTGLKQITHDGGDDPDWGASPRASRHP